MKSAFRLLSLGLIVGWCLTLAGCATTKDVNPAGPKANTGYVDFHTDFDSDLSWEIKRSDLQTGAMKTVYSEFEPLPGSVLRLAAPPGKYRYQVWFMNQATEGPETVQVDVVDSKVTPVRVTLTPTGQRMVKQESYGYHASGRGYNRGTKTTSELNEVYRIAGIAEPARDYQSKERMPYYRPSK
jgi:hypothetical protein